MPTSSSRGRLVVLVNDARFLLTHRMELVEAARTRGYDVIVAAPHPITDSIADAVEVIRARGFPVEFVGFRSQSLDPFSEGRGVAQIASLYRRLRPRIAHHVTIKPVLYGTVAARLAHVPGVVNAISGLGTLFGSAGPWTVATRAMARTAYRMVLRHPNTRVIFQNADDRRTFLDARVIRPALARLIPGSGVRVESFSGLPEPAGPPVVVLTARLLRQKGVYEFAAAARQLRAAGLEARFALVGDAAANRDAVPGETLAEWQRSGIVELWGWRTDMRAVLAHTTIVCLPSYYREGVPKALLEAAAAGRAIVTTDMPGCRDIVTHDVSGLLVPPRDVSALAGALRRLITEPATRARLGAAAQSVAAERFALERVIGATLAVYEELDAPATAAASPGSSAVEAARAATRERATITTPKPSARWSQESG
ncbi:MAG TPA: glycosyltransferase family 4 protein [Gemmatimonadaceae bacterium]|nr:glycosyltransferase family 4 protein [Gemmatimonadaceae bacterium]